MLEFDDLDKHEIEGDFDDLDSNIDSVQKSTDIDKSIKLEANIDDIRKILKFMARGYNIPPIIYNTIFKTAVRELEDKGKVVLVKRDPNVERGRIQGMFVKIIDGRTIELHPTVIGGFGADFDGDKMAIYAPMSNEAQTEVKEKMISATSNLKLNSTNFSLGNEMVIGIFTITYLESTGSYKKIQNIKDAMELHPSQRVEININGNKIQTTAGRVIFNSNLPRYVPFINEPMNKKKLNGLLSKLIIKNRTDYATTVDKLMKLGFKYATIYPSTVSLDMFEIPKEIEDLKIKLSKEKDPVNQSEIIAEMEKKLLVHLQKNQPDLYILIESGSIRGILPVRQIMVAKGLILDTMGNLLPPVTKSIQQGFSPENYFDAAMGSRKGTIDRALNTADGGYAYRKMIYVLGATTANIENADCGTKRYLTLKLTKNLFNRMSGRYVLDEKTNGLIPISEDMIGKIIKLRSPVYCKSKEICRTCYGDLIYQVKTKNIGIVSAQECLSLSEKIMKCNYGLINDLQNLQSMEDIWDNM